MLDDIREWISDNLRYILLGVAALLIVLMVFFVVRLVTRGSGKNDDSGSAGRTVVQDEGQVQQKPADDPGDVENDLGVDEPATEAGDVSEGPDESVSNLQKDDPDVLALVKDYYSARAAKDITTLSQIVTPWDSATQDYLLQKDLIESYNEISTYSEKGLEDGSYVVFTSFKAKIPNFETLVPGLRMQYLVTEEDTLKVYADYESDTKISEFVTSVSKDADVQQLLAEVNREYEEALAGDEALAAYLKDLTEDASGGEADATTDDTSEEQVKTALYGLNIRESTSTESAILGTVLENAEVNVLEDAGDGWSKISYDPGTGEIIGYVRTEYLE